MSDQVSQRGAGSTQPGPGYWPAVPVMAPPGWGPHAAGPHHGGPNVYYVPYGPGYGPGWGPVGQAPTPAQAAQAPGLLNNRFVLGMVVGGALTYVLTNEAVQRAAIRTAMQLWLSIQGGWEETKERFRDAESEVRSARDE